MRTASHDVLDHGFFAEVTARRERVANVVFKGVVRAEHGCDAALRPARRGVCAAPLGDQADTAVLRDAERVEEPGDSTSYDQEVEASIKTTTSMIEPIMITVMGLIVGGIALALLLPIFQLSRPG